MENRNNVAVIFGATGFVGSYLIRTLLEENWQVWAVTRGPKHLIIPVSDQGLNWINWDDTEYILKDNVENIFVFHFLQ